MSKVGQTRKFKNIIQCSILFCVDYEFDWRKVWVLLVWHIPSLGKRAKPSKTAYASKALIALGGLEFEVVQWIVQ